MCDEQDRISRLIRALNTVMDAYAGEYGGRHTAWSEDDLEWLELSPEDVDVPEGTGRDD